MDLTRFFPQRLWRNLIILLLALLVLASTAVVYLIIYELWTFQPPHTDQVSGFPPWVEKIPLPILQRDLKFVLAVIFIVGLAFVCLVLFIAVNFIRADKVKIWGVEFQISEELTQAREELEAQIELVAGLQENVREIQDLVEQQSLLVLNPDVNGYFEYLDKIVETSAFVIRPQSRSVHASIWLYQKKIDQMRMVAGYRLGQRTLRNLVMTLGENGFAPFVLRSQRPQERVSPSVGQDWKLDSDNTTPTTSILGQPILVGADDDWQAVLCFSTDRDTGKFPEYRFSVDKDAATLRFFTGVISFVLTLARDIQAESSDGAGQEPLIKLIYQRYI